jgi:hypothetical protein
MTFAFFPFGYQSWSTDEDSLPLVTGSYQPFVIYDANVLLDAARCQGTVPDLVATQASDVPKYFFGPSSSFDFIKDAEYSLGLYASLRKYGSNLAFESRMEIYLVGTAFPTDNPLGIKIGEYVLNDAFNYHRYQYQYFNFFPKVSGQGYLRFVVYGGQWHISDLTLQPASEFGFTPNESLHLIPVINHKFETLTFKTEFYDLDNNLFPATAVTTPLKFDGGTIFIKGPGNRVDGTISVGPSGSNGPVITSTGFNAPSGPSGSLVYEPGMPAIYIGSGSFGQADTAFLVGSSSIGPVISVGNVLKGANDGPSGSFLLEVSGTLAIAYYAPDVYTDIRTVLTGFSGSSAYIQFLIAYSMSLFSQSMVALSSSLVQSFYTSSIVNDVNKIKLPTSVKSEDGLYLESSSMGFYDKAHDNYSVVINADGSFRFADKSSWTGDVNDPYARMVGFANGAFVVRTRNLLLDTPGLQIFGGDSVAPASNAIKMGISASSMNFTTGQGFYADGAGNVRFGDSLAQGEFFSFTPGVGNGPGSLIISSSNFFLQAGSGSANLKLNAFQFIMGNTPNVPSVPPGNGFSGVYMDVNGNFFTGNDTNYMKWDGSTLKVAGSLSGSDITGTSGTFTGTVAATRFTAATAQFRQNIELGGLTVVGTSLSFQDIATFVTPGKVSILQSMPYTSPRGKGLYINNTLYLDLLDVSGNIYSNGYQVPMFETGSLPTGFDIRPRGMIRFV